MSLRRHALLLAATLPAPLLSGGCSGPAPAGNEANQAATSQPQIAAAPHQTLSADVPAENATTPAQVAKVAADYVGKWVGPEGLVLDVKPKTGDDVTIVNQWTLDDHGTFAGAVTADGLRFTRGGQTVTARPSSGAATGMKWLADKRDCLTVVVGSEAYCRS